LRDCGELEATPNWIIAEGADWRLRHELRRELKARVTVPENVGSWLRTELRLASPKPACFRYHPLDLNH
jgi:hypothetical protein